MAYLSGEKILLGLGLEQVRGTAVDPQVWIPARAASTIASIVEQVQIKETRGSGISTDGSEVTTIRAEGDLEFNVRVNTIGYILRSLLGQVSSSTDQGATTHIFSRSNLGPQFPSLTLALSQPGQQSYAYPLAIVSKLELRTPIDDLVNATVSFMAKSESAHPAYSPVWTTDDVYFRSHDVVISFADDLSGLNAAQGVCIKEFAFTIANNARPNLCLGDINPGDILTLITELSGSFKTDFEGVEEYYDVFKAAGRKAMRIKMVRDDLAPIGTSGKYPTLQIDLASVTFTGYKADRPLDDIVQENIDFMAHYSEDDGEAITVTLINGTGDYTEVSASHSPSASVSPSSSTSPSHSLSPSPSASVSPSHSVSNSPSPSA